MSCGCNFVSHELGSDARAGYTGSVLRALTLKNFKSFRDETIRFSKTGMTVLVGTNGSGKSSVLDAASYATFSFQTALPALPGAELVRAGADGFELELSGEFEDGTAGCEVVFRKSRLVAKWFERAGVRQYTWDAIQRRNRPNEEPLDDSLIAKLERAFPVPRVLKVSLARLRHPQRELVRVLREVVKLGRVEVLCTTHSPYILSEFHYDEVRVLREVDGVSRCQALSDGPDAAKWMKELDAGEYWSFVEKQMFEKRSA